MVTQLRSTCRDQELWKLTIGSSLIIMYKDGAYLLVLTSELCGPTQNALKSTCLWSNLRKADYLIYLRSSKGKLSKMHMVESCSSFSLFICTCILLYYLYLISAGVVSSILFASLQNNVEIFLFRLKRIWKENLGVEI